MAQLWSQYVSFHFPRMTAADKRQTSQRQRLQPTASWLSAKTKTTTTNPKRASATSSPTKFTTRRVSRSTSRTSGSATQPEPSLSSRGWTSESSVASSPPSSDLPAPARQQSSPSSSASTPSRPAARSCTTDTTSRRSTSSTTARTFRSSPRSPTYSPVPSARIFYSVSRTRTPFQTKQSTPRRGMQVSTTSSSRYPRATTPRSATPA